MDYIEFLATINDRADATAERLRAEGNPLAEFGAEVSRVEDLSTALHVLAASLRATGYQLPEIPVA